MISEERRAYNREYYARNREELKAKQRARTRMNPERRKVTDRAYYAENRELIVERARAKRLRQYGLTPAQYDALLAFQGGGCGICGREAPDPTHSRFGVDHDHGCCPGVKSCGVCVRGLLCTSCNTGSGVLDWPLERIEKMLGYRADPPWQRLGLAHPQLALTGGE